MSETNKDSVGEIAKKAAIGAVAGGGAGGAAGLSLPLAAPGGPARNHFGRRPALSSSRPSIGVNPPRRPFGIDHVAFAPILSEVMADWSRNAGPLWQLAHWLTTTTWVWFHLVGFQAAVVWHAMQLVAPTGM